MPHDYRRALQADLARAVSTGGDGFYTTESEAADADAEEVAA
jgi:hypothetical protein